jgi:hypothetical protein
VNETAGQPLTDDEVEDRAREATLRLGDAARAETAAMIVMGRAARGP